MFVDDHGYMKDLCYDPMVLSTRSTAEFSNWRCDMRYERLGYTLQRLYQVKQFFTFPFISSSIKLVPTEAGGCLLKPYPSPFADDQVIACMADHKLRLQRERVLRLKDEDLPLRRWRAYSRLKSARDKIEYLKVVVEKTQEELDLIDTDIPLVHSALESVTVSGHFDKSAALRENTQFREDWYILRQILKREAGEDILPAGEDMSAKYRSAK